MPNGKSTAGIYLSPTLFCIELLSISVYGVQQHNSGLVGSSLTSFGGGLCMQTAKLLYQIRTMHLVLGNRTASNITKESMFSQ